MFDLSLPKLLVLAVIALVIFGPGELPAIAARAGRARATCARSPRAAGVLAANGEPPFVRYQRPEY